MEPTHVDSAGDARTANNTMRHQYRVLTETEKAQMVQIKDQGETFLALIYAIAGDDPRVISRELAIARTKIEEAVMWAVKYVTR